MTVEEPYVRPSQSTHSRDGTPDSDATNFPEVANLFETKAGDYAWKSFGVTTADLYQLTLFRMVGSHSESTRRSKYPRSKGPILFVHGFATDSVTWFNKSDDAKVIAAAQLFQQGYDVWFANMRGSEFSREHYNLDADENDATYWSFDTKKKNEQDMKAIIRRIKEVSTTCRKITLVGHSVGGQAVTTALAASRYADKYVQQAVLLEPCWITNVDNLTALTVNDYFGLSNSLKFLGIESLYGPNWESQKEQLCGLYPDLCPTLINFKIFDYKNNLGESQEICVKEAETLMQNYYQDRYQPFANYYTQGMVTTPEINLANISSAIPIKIQWTTEDELCPLDKQRKFADRLPNKSEKFVTSEYRTNELHHGQASFRNDAEWMSILNGLLGSKVEDMAESDCTTRGFYW